MTGSVPRFNLADMTAQQLADEMIRRIPAYTREYLNPQIGDPGRTMIDLMAWMGETILYRVNLLPRRQRLEFLRLLGLALRAAEPAQGIVALSHKKKPGAAAQFVTQDTRLPGPVPFETRGPVNVLPIEGQIYYKRRLEGPEVEALQDVIADLAELYGITAADPYATTRLFEDGMGRIGGEDPLAGSIDGTLWIALLALEDTDPSRQAVDDALDAQPALLSVGVVPKLGPTAPSVTDGLAPDPIYFDWALSSRVTIGDVQEDIFLPLQVTDDSTAHLSQDGTLRLVMPSSVNMALPQNDLDEDLAAGTGDRPPRIDDPDVAARLKGWVRMRPRDDASSLSPSLPLSWIGINAVQIDAKVTTRQVQIGIANGRPMQSFSLPAQNVDPDTLSLSVQEGGSGFIRWTRVEDLASQGRTDRAFSLDAAAGTITLGDGLSGVMPAVGSRLRLDYMQSGGGPEGNVSAGSLTKIEQPGLLALLPVAPSGGRAGETLEAAEKRVRAHLQHQDRCVTEADYHAIAADLDVGRIEVMPRFRPYQQRDDVAGVVTVMALPDKPVSSAPNPRPDRRLIDRVYTHLDARRPIGTELFVVAPDYVPFGLSVAVNIRDGFAEEDVVSNLRAALQQFYWPLTGGDRDGGGWTLGQAVTNLEAELIAARVEGVRTTAGVALFSDGPVGMQRIPQDPGTGTQSLTLERWQLPELLQIDVAVGATAPPLTLSTGSAGSGSDSGGTAIPVVPEVC